MTAAIGFPVIILLLIPLRILLIPRLPFTVEELAILDGPTASPFVSPFYPFAPKTAGGWPIFISCLFLNLKVLKPDHPCHLYMCTASQPDGPPYFVPRHLSSIFIHFIVHFDIHFASILSARSRSAKRSAFSILFYLCEDVSLNHRLDPEGLPRPNFYILISDEPRSAVFNTHRLIIVSERSPAAVCLHLFFFGSFAASCHHVAPHAPFLHCLLLGLQWVTEWIMFRLEDHHDVSLGAIINEMRLSAAAKYCAHGTCNFDAASYCPT